MPALLKPPLLKPGDHVIIIAPAGFVSDDYVHKASKIFESWGLKVLHGENLFMRHNQFSGTDKQRLADLQEALDNDEVSAIICARGGYGTLRIADRLNLSQFIKKPKWLVGFSDITVLHSILTKLGIQSVHSLMPINFSNLPESAMPIELLRQALFEGRLNYTPAPSAYNRQGTEKAVVTGGNLSLLYALTATPFEIDTRNKVLFIEDVGEQLYHLDRMVQSLRLAGKFDQLNGLIVGGLSEMEDKNTPFGQTAEEIVASAAQGYDFPVVFDFPAGHIAENCPVILGSEATLEVTVNSVKISFA
ncbi:MAG: LD-carboxypeptidase [Bacteroidales bacterium]|nr:LD-carboxypeptidase [Bacteroidales bacterium]